MRRPATRALLAALTMLAAACSPHPVGPPARPGAALEAGDHDLAVKMDGGVRTYVLHVPSRAGPPAPRPLILAFHGGAGTGAGFKRYAGFDAVAARHGVLVAYLDGSGPLGRRLLTWNAGECCGHAHAAGVDDVAFAIAVMHDVARRVPVDGTRVYATGHSNGAMMAYRLALEAPERLAAIAPVAAMMVLEHPPPARPVPVLHIHSVDDPRSLYAGGLGDPFPFTSEPIRYRPVEATLADWARRSGCPAEPVAVERRETPTAAGHRAELLAWRPCAAGVEVHLWRITGAGHGWPGRRGPVPAWWMGPYTDVIDAAEEAWRFFRRFRSTGAPPL